MTMSSDDQDWESDPGRFRTGGGSTSAHPSLASPVSHTVGQSNKVERHKSGDQGSRRPSRSKLMSEGFRFPLFYPLSRWNEIDLRCGFSQIHHCHRVFQNPCDS